MAIEAAREWSVVTVQDVEPTEADRLLDEALIEIARSDAGFNQRVPVGAGYSGK